MNRKFFLPTLTFEIENASSSILNKLSDFNIKNVKTKEDGLVFDVPLIYKRRVEKVLGNQSFIIKRHRNIIDVISFFYSNSIFVGCLVFMIIVLTIMNGLVFRINIQGLEGEEKLQVIQFLRDNGVRNLTWRRSHSRELATQLIQEFDFIVHSNMSARGTTLVFNIYRASTPPGASRTDIISMHDAVITSLIVISGIPRVQIGDIVRVRQVLVEASFQIGVEVGEMDEYGNWTYSPITHPGVAIAQIHGEISFSRSSVTSSENSAMEHAEALYKELILNYGFDENDERDMFITRLDDGTYSTEVVIRRNVILHT